MKINPNRKVIFNESQLADSLFDPAIARVRAEMEAVIRKAREAWRRGETVVLVSGKERRVIG